MSSSTDFVVFHFLHLSLWSIWNYFSVRREGNPGLLMSRRVKWSEPSFRNINLAAAYNLEGRRIRIQQENLAIEIIWHGHWGLRRKLCPHRNPRNIPPKWSSMDWEDYVFKTIRKSCSPFPHLELHNRKENIKLCQELH